MATKRFSDTLTVGTPEWRRQRYAEHWAAANPQPGEWEEAQDRIWEAIGEEENDALQALHERRIMSELEGEF